MAIMNAIVADGAKRLRKALETEVRREHAQELANTASFWKRALIERKISAEVSRRMKIVSSPGSLYFARRFRFVNRV